MPVRRARAVGEGTGQRPVPRKTMDLSKPMAPEDLTPQTYVAALYVITEHLTLAEYLGVDEPWNRRGIVRTTWLPCRDSGVPLKIAEVCLPFVLAEKPDGTFVT